MAAVDVTILGRVQGVSFRYHTQKEAARLGVRGWVRNDPDGSVSAHLEGPSDAVDALVRWCRHGPVGSRVTHVSVRDSADTGSSGFDVRF